MTDRTMREKIEALLIPGDWESDPYEYRDEISHNEAIEAVLRILDAHTAEHTEVEVQAIIDRAPEPLRRLGEWLSKKLDEDDWKSAEPLLLGAAAHTAAQPAPDAPKCWHPRTRHSMREGTVTCEVCGASISTFEPVPPPVVSHETPVHVTQTGLSDTDAPQQPAPDAVADAARTLERHCTDADIQAIYAKNERMNGSLSKAYGFRDVLRALAKGQPSHD